MELTIDKLNELSNKYLFDLPPSDHRYSYITTRNNWLVMRDLKMCDFTDEELNSDKNPFKRGWIVGCGKVDMYVDRYYENADNVATMDRINKKFKMEFAGE